jgi:hypothetical protein
VVGATVVGADDREDPHDDTIAAMATGAASPTHLHPICLRLAARNILGRTR